MATPHAEPEPVIVGYDNGFVAMFDRINNDMWSRQPGERLTIGQKSTIAGQTFTALLIIDMVFCLAVFLGMNVDE